MMRMRNDHMTPEVVAEAQGCSPGRVCVLGISLLRFTAYPITGFPIVGVQESPLGCNNSL